MEKKLWISLLFIAVIGVIGYNYVYQDHRNISEESADFTVNATSLSQAFKINTQDAETKYLNKTLVVKGEISEINLTDLTLNDVVFCNFISTNKTTNTLKLNKTITIKGRCIGYDDLLEQIKLDQCTLTN